MIENAQQLQDTRDALVQVERALLSLKEKVKATNPQLFAAMSEGYQTDIRMLRAQIDEYLGIVDAPSDAAEHSGAQAE